MKKRFHSLLMIFAFAVFLISSLRLLGIISKYRLSSQVQQEAASEYTRIAPATKPKTDEGPPAESSGQKDGWPSEDGDTEGSSQGSSAVYAPIEVDFTRLRQACGDAVGWIYCEGSVISYPVVYGRDNEYYLEHNYMGEYDPSGAIFTDMQNKNGFADANVILYGHHMQDGSMFASLKNWYDQAYYEEHPVMWLLTPEQDYRVDLFAGYVTSADSQTYTVFHDGGEKLEAYLNWAKQWSEITAPVETPADGHYVVLSTCAYSSELARTALHGKLVPVDSAGGVPIK